MSVFKPSPSGRRAYFRGIQIESAMLRIVLGALPVISALSLAPAHVTRAAPVCMSMRPAEPSRRSLLLGGAAAAVLLPASAAHAASPAVFAPAQDSLTGKTVLITGANTGLGLESAKRLAAGGAKVIVTARTEAKVQKTIASVIDYAGPSARVVGAELDLASLDSIKSFPKRLQAQLGAADYSLDVLMNNAGVMAIPERLTTDDGFERQLGVNHLGHFALTAALIPALQRAENGFRVVAVSSDAHRFANGQSMQQAIAAHLDPAEYTPWGNYGLSKAANVLFANELERRLKESGVRGSAVSLHPGVVATDLARYLVAAPEDQSIEQLYRIARVPGTAPPNAGSPELPWWQGPLLRVLANVLIPVEYGANTQVWLAAGADAQGDLSAGGGRFYDKRAATPASTFTNDEALAKALWEESEKLTQTKLTFK